MHISYYRSLLFLSICIIIYNFSYNQISVQPFKVNQNEISLEKTDEQICEDFLNGQQNITYMNNHLEKYNIKCHMNDVEVSTLLSTVIASGNLTIVKQIVDHVKIDEKFQRNKIYDIFDTATGLALIYEEIEIFEFLLHKQKDSIAEIIDPTLFNVLTHQDPSNELLEYLTSKDTLLYNQRDSHGVLWYNIKDDHGSSLFCNVLFNKKYNALLHLLKFEDIEVSEECIIYSDEHILSKKNYENVRFLQNDDIFTDDDVEFYSIQLEYIENSFTDDDDIEVSYLIHVPYIKNSTIGYYGDIKSLKSMSSKDLKVDDMLDKKYSPIIWAVYLESFDIVRLLLKETNIDVNVICEEYTALSLAVRNNNFEMVELLLTKEGIDINRLLDGHTALSLAIYNNNLEIVKLLLDQKDIELNRITYYNNNTLLSIVMRLHLKEQENIFNHVYYDENHQIVIKKNVHLNIKNGREIDLNQDYSEIVDLLLKHPKIEIK